MQNIQSLVNQLTLEEKTTLCGGGDPWHTASIPRLNIPSITLSDGPHGLRKQEGENVNLGDLKNSKTSICFPAACCSSCSFDPQLLKKMGEALGEEMLAEDISIILGPAVNIKRSPLCGRNFEYFSEDPFLSTTLSTSLIEGVQSKGVGTCIKHFAANNQEYHRQTMSSEVDERTLREIYLASFEGAIKEGKPWTVMASYNRINGVYSTENNLLLTKILRDEWKWNLNSDPSHIGGFVMSDWCAVSDRVKGISAGLDLEMPGPCRINRDEIINAVKKGILDVNYLDQCVSRVLNVVFKAQEVKEKGKTDMSLNYGKGVSNVENLFEKHHEIAREIAENSIVLLKNDDSILSLSYNKKILFVGEIAKKWIFTH